MCRLSGDCNSLSYIDIKSGLVNVRMESSSPSLSVSAAIAGMASANASMEAIASRCSREGVRCPSMNIDILRLLWRCVSSRGAPLAGGCHEQVYLPLIQQVVEFMAYALHIKIIGDWHFRKRYISHAFSRGRRVWQKGANVSEGKPEVGTDINICRELIGFGSTTIP